MPSLNNGFKKLKIKKRERERERKHHRTTKLNVEAEVYNNNKKCDGGKKKIKSLIGFHGANKIDNFNRGGEKRKKEKKTLNNLQNKSKHKNN